jgi:hypothetical protein
MSVHPPRVLIPLLFIACLACDENAMPTRPGSSSVALSIMYRQAIPPPPELRGTGCTHHFATSTVSINNVALTRVIELSSPTRQALAFTVTSTGAVAP